MSKAHLPFPMGVSRKYTTHIIYIMYEYIVRRAAWEEQRQGLVVAGHKSL